jgi:ATP-dependent RNA helicase DeaD
VPYDTESYVHRIGRTGRAGRAGEAILFITPRERNMLRYIERATRSPLEPMDLPTVADVNEQRVARFRQRITEAIAAGQAEPYRGLIEEFEREHDIPAIEIASALASLWHGGSPLLLKEKATDAGGERAERGRVERREGQDERPETERVAPAGRLTDEDAETFRIEVGYVHGVRPGNIVGAIANVAGLEGRQIGHVDIREDHTYVGLPKGMPDAIMRELSKTRVAGRMLQISTVSHVPPKALRKPPKRRRPST